MALTVTQCFGLPSGDCEHNLYKLHVQLLYLWTALTDIRCGDLAVGRSRLLVDWFASGKDIEEECGGDLALDDDGDLAVRRPRRRVTLQIGGTAIMAAGHRPIPAFLPQTTSCRARWKASDFR